MQRFVIYAFVPLSLCAQDATWISTSSDDLETAGNWTLGVIPTGVATFDSTVLSVNLTPQVLPSGPTSFSLSNFAFSNAADFSFTINGPYALGFVGTGCGITGSATNTVITATNDVASMPVSQLTFSGVGVVVGDAQLFSVVQASASLLNDSATKDLAQIVFDGSGDSASKECTLTIDSTVAALHANNDGSITVATTPVNNVGQIVFDGSGGMSASGAGEGSSTVTLLGNTLLTADIALNQVFGSGSDGDKNNVTQILFDGSGGFSGSAGGTGQSSVTLGGDTQLLATLPGGSIQSIGVCNDIAQIAFNGSGGTSWGGGGKGRSTVVLKDSAQLSATAPNFGYVGYYSTGETNDTAQILFSGSGGLSHGAAGEGSASVTITDSATLYTNNTYYMTGNQTYCNDVVQILFDGSGGAGIHNGGSGSLVVTIDGDVEITAENADESGFMYTSTYANDLAQILFDGTPGLNYGGGGSGFCSTTIGGNAQISASNDNTISNFEEYTNDVGQIVFDGSGGFGNAAAVSSGVVVGIEGNAVLTANNALTAVLKGGYGNDCAQILFDGSGGFAYDHAGAGSAQVTLQGAAQCVATNLGSLVGNGAYGNNLAQILFDGSGGSSSGIGSSHGTGSCTLAIEDTVTLQATNVGILGNSLNTLASNNIAQILFDGSGGLNSDGGSGGSLSATLSSTTPVSAVNETGGIMSSNTGSAVNKIGQIIVDGSLGSATSSVSSGRATLTLSHAASLSASNSGTIESFGTTQGLGQILFDGRPGSSGAGSCVLQLGSANTLIALNTVSGVVDGDQIAFYDTVVHGNGVAHATNALGTIGHGIAFYGPTSMAEDLNVMLTASSLWVDATTTPSFTLGPLSGDTTSSAILNQTTTINTASGVAGAFDGDISGSAGITIRGSGQQIFAGTNSYEGATLVSSGTLTLQHSNIPATLLVAQGGTFSGTGTVAGAATIEGRVQPGNSPGTLYFSSGLTLAPSATTQIEVDKTQASLLAVSGGNASIAGSLKVLEDSGVRLGKSYPIVTVSGGDVVGRFRSVENTGAWIPIVTYLADEVTLTLTTPPSSFGALLYAPDRILRNLETLKHLDVRRATAFAASQTESETPGSKLTIAMVGDMLPELPAQDREPVSPRPWSVYVEPTGSFGHVKSRRNVVGNTFQSAGARGGFDYLWTEACIGLGLITEYNHWWGQQYHHAGTFTSDVAYGSLYGTFVPKTLRELSVNLIGGGGYSWYTFERPPLGSSSPRAQGDPGGALADALFDVEYAFQHKNFRLTPTAALQYTYAHINGYRETGAGIYDMHVDAQTSMTLSSLLGFRTGYCCCADSPITLTPELMAEWQYQYLDSSVNTTMFATASVGEFPFIVPGFARNSLIAGADLRIGIHDNVAVQLNYDLWYNRTALINFFLLECKVEF